MSVIQLILLAFIQGITELLPISSSGHVIVVAKLFGIDPTKPEMIFLVVMLHTGTMLATICFYWQSWRNIFFASKKICIRSMKLIVLATALTGCFGLTIKFFIEKIICSQIPNVEIEMIFGNLTLISISLASVGLLIIYSGLKKQTSNNNNNNDRIITKFEACLIGSIQGICLPFRGFSRSGATISTGLIIGIPKNTIENFSFALSVALTPPIIIRAYMRLYTANNAALLSSSIDISNLIIQSTIGIIISFTVGILALKWLSAWLENGRWYIFGIYCLCASIVVISIKHYLL